MEETEDGASLFVGVLVSAAVGCICASIIGAVRQGYISGAWRWIVARFPSPAASKHEFMQSVRNSIKSVQSVPNSTPSQPDQVSVKKTVAQSKPSKHKQGPFVKAQPTVRHRLEINSLKGHGDAITGIAFTSNGRGVASACADKIVRIFKLDDASTKNYQCLKLNIPTGIMPVGVAFGEGASQIVVATQDVTGSGLLMFGAADGKAAALAREQGKLPPPEIKWKKEQIHDRKSVLTCVGAHSDYGSGDGSVLVATCSEGTDIKLWTVESGKCVGTADTNQLKNTMATLSPDGRFLAAAAFTADVKVWEIIYGKDGQVQDLVKVMLLLKGHKSAVTWVCFTWDSERIITASKDGSVRIWNINVRYNMNEDPKCLKVFPVNGHFDKIAVSPDNKILAATQGTTLIWLSTEDGQVLETVKNAHDGEITCMVWAPQPLATDQGRAQVLATGSSDKKLKLWAGL